MTFDEMKSRVAILQDAVKKSVENLNQQDTEHKILCGRLNEAVETLNYMEQQAKAALEVVAKEEAKLVAAE